MDILEILLTKSINHHYAKKYVKFIQGCSTKIRIEGEYLEKHHILPIAKTQFPEYKSFSKNPWNLIKLTGREHFIAHWMLWKSQGGFMAYAFAAMSRSSKYQKDRYFKINSKIYEELKKEVAQKQSVRIISEETRKKMSESQKNREKIICPHCNKSGDFSNMMRWHFDNCKKITGILKHKINPNVTIVTCPHCNKKGKMLGMRSNHFDHCPKIKDRSIKDRIKCPHCNTEIANTKDKTRLHFNNCPEKSRKANPARSEKTKGIPKEKITCPHCNKIGGKPVMMYFHFENCKFKK